MALPKAQSTYIYRVQNSVWRLSNNWPPSSSPPSECVLPPHQRPGGTHSPGGEGWGVNISEDARHWIGLLQYNPSTIKGNDRNDLRCPGMCTLDSCWLGCSGPWAEHGTPQSNSLASELITRNARLLTLSNFRPSLSCILRDFATMLTCHASSFWRLIFCCCLWTQTYIPVILIKYVVRSLKFIWAPCAQLYSLAETPQLPPTIPRIWAHIRGCYWSAKIDDISLWPPDSSELLATYYDERSLLRIRTLDLFKVRGDSRPKPEYRNSCSLQNDVEPCS